MKSECSLLKRVQRTIEKYQMLVPNSKVIVGVSGGPDSTTLLHLLYRIKSQYNLQLCVAHLNHRLRGKEAQEEAKWVKELASGLDIPVILNSFDVALLAKRKGLSLEEAARLARYDFLEQAANQIGASKIALGHTASDQIETFLMRLMWGSGLEGLSGIPPVRGRIIRPLIEIFREEIEEYCKDNNLRPRRDSSNEETSFLRNKIRLHLIPYLSERYNPQLRKGLFQTIEILREENEYFQGESERIFKSLHKEKRDEQIILDIEELTHLPLALKRRIIREAIRRIKGDLRRVKFNHVDSVLELTERKGSKQLDLPGNLIIKKQGKHLIFGKKEEKKEVFFPCALVVPGRTRLSRLGLDVETEVVFKLPPFFPKNKDEAYLDFDKLKEPLLIRRRKKGDKFQPLGMKGRKKIKDFFIDLKVPREERDRIPLLTSEDRIVWVVGYRIDECFKITKDTKKILKVRISKGYE